MHLGFDRLQYPGDDVMQSLWQSTPMAFAAVYLAPAPSQRYTGWMAHAAPLKADGWGLVPVYVGQQATGGPGSHVLTAAQGATDATGAAALAATAGLDAGAVVYLDIEQGGQLGADFMDYIEAWVTGMASTDYRAGVYCSYSRTAAQVADRVGSLPAWVYHPRDGGPTTVDLAAEVAPDPADSGFAAATVWQYRMSLKGSIDLTWTDSTGTRRRLAGVDLDSAWCLDPSDPTPPVPSLSGVWPTSGTAGDSVTVTGADFVGLTDLAFGSVSAAGMQVASDMELTATVPDGLSGQTVALVATNRWGNQSTEAVSFAVDQSDPGSGPTPPPTVTQVWPDSGAPGDQVTVVGSGFETVTDVAFGEVNAAQLEIGSDTELTAVVPSGLEDQSVLVTVTDRWGRHSGDQVGFEVVGAAP